MTRAVAASRSASSKALGTAGILGGAVLLAAFVIEIAPGLNNLRLVLYNLGAIAVIVAVYRRQRAASSTLARAVAGATLAANAWHLAMVVLSTGQSNPFGGAFGLAFFYAAIALWLTDAAFGVVLLRHGDATRWGGLALAVGSVLALTGIDRLGLTSASNPTIFGPVALIGVALNGLGWIILGFNVAVRGPTPEAASRPFRARPVPERRQ